MFGLVFQFSVSPVCESCKASPATAALFITSRVAALERALQVSLVCYENVKKNKIDEL
jgi:hypothetical protein